MTRTVSMVDVWVHVERAGMGEGEKHWAETSALSKK